MDGKTRHLQDPDSFLGGEIEIVACFDVEDIIPVVSVDHDTIDTLAEQRVDILFIRSFRISSTHEGKIGCALATSEIAACLVESLHLQTTLLTLESMPNIHE